MIKARVLAALGVALIFLGFITAVEGDDENAAVFGLIALCLVVLAWIIAYRTERRSVRPGFPAQRNRKYTEIDTDDPVQRP